MKNSNAIIWILLLLLVVGGLSSLLSLPVYKQNRYQALKREEKMIKDSLLMVSEELQEARLELNQYRSREYVGSFAEEVLGLQLLVKPRYVEVGK